MTDERHERERERGRDGRVGQEVRKGRVLGCTGGLRDREHEMAKG
jgi:hypothetical protein